ncbi:hypothetical protein SAMN05446037_100132 [Anaerovirgula multivorans]|uniref:Uncharacterized protein n=1 Tax=Anaerovirgula multivorans TaxID=312168 RepID=A0A238ZS21_9FIRM|nr:hypothetical protein [Anaerovirgula multivorans]SNR85534.1 hypothetical protein SAMN05446037_100132 [Anaerovirgula multivorans]
MGKAIGIKVKNFDTKADRKYFTQKCSQFWLEVISEQINALPVNHDKKIEFAKEVVEEVHRKMEKKKNAATVTISCN